MSSKGRNGVLFVRLTVGKEVVLKGTDNPISNLFSEYVLYELGNWDYKNNTTQKKRVHVPKSIPLELTPCLLHILEDLLGEGLTNVKADKPVQAYFAQEDQEKSYLEREELKQRVRALLKSKYILVQERVKGDAFEFNPELVRELKAWTADSAFDSLINYLTNHSLSLEDIESDLAKRCKKNPEIILETVDKTISPLENKLLIEIAYRDQIDSHKNRNLLHAKGLKLRNESLEKYAHHTSEDQWTIINLGWELRRVLNLLRDEDAMMTLGRVMGIDLLIGNGDHFNGIFYILNMSNFLFSTRHSDNTQGKKIILFDNEAFLFSFKDWWSTKAYRRDRSVSLYYSQLLRGGEGVYDEYIHTANMIKPLENFDEYFSGFVKSFFRGSKILMPLFDHCSYLRDGTGELWESVKAKIKMGFSEGMKQIDALDPMSFYRRAITNVQGGLSHSMEVSYETFYFRHYIMSSFYHGHSLGAVEERLNALQPYTEIFASGKDIGIIPKAYTLSEAEDAIHGRFGLARFTTWYSQGCALLKNQKVFRSECPKDLLNLFVGARVLRGILNGPLCDGRSVNAEWLIPRGIFPKVIVRLLWGLKNDVIFKFEFASVWKILEMGLVDMRTQKALASLGEGRRRRSSAEVDEDLNAVRCALLKALMSNEVSAIRSLANLLAEGGRITGEDILVNLDSMLLDSRDVDKAARQTAKSLDFGNYTCASLYCRELGRIQKRKLLGKFVVSTTPSQG